MGLGALNTGATGMVAQSQNLEVIANNLANISNIGFKKNRANFEELLYKTIKMPGAGAQGQNQTPSLGLVFGLGTRVSATQPNFVPGTPRASDRSLDVAINGPGFFRIDDGFGNFYYTRAGNFTLDSLGRIVMATSTQGYIVQPPIIIPQDAITVAISPDGQVAITQQTNPIPQIVGQLDAVRFQNPEGLLHVGNNLFRETASSNPPELGQWAINGFGQINQGFVETSNVEPVEELINLITSQRAYELNAQVVQTANQNLQTLQTLRQ